MTQTSFRNGISKAVGELLAGVSNNGHTAGAMQKRLEKVAQMAGYPTLSAMFKDLDDKRMKGPERFPEHKPKAATKRVKASPLQMFLEDAPQGVEVKIERELPTQAQINRARWGFQV